jgi:hypothetical protein
MPIQREPFWSIVAVQLMQATDARADFGEVDFPY